MSEITIWSYLRKGGLSSAGTAGVMGNFYCESLLKSNNVEDRCSMSDEDYTYNVDNGIISEDRWSTDAYGYGLYQLTYHTRKRGYLRYAKSKGVSVSDEAAQCEYCIKELKEEHPNLYSFLCSTTDVYTAASRFCKEFERPAVNNITPRANKAQEYYVKYNDVTGFTADVESSCESVEQESTLMPYAFSNTLKMGDRGILVITLQSLLNYHGATLKIDGDFGSLTLAALENFQTTYGLDATGICDEPTWAAF